MLTRTHVLGGLSGDAATRPRHGSDPAPRGGGRVQASCPAHRESAFEELGSVFLLFPFHTLPSRNKLSTKTDPEAVRNPIPGGGPSSSSQDPQGPLLPSFQPLPTLSARPPAAQRAAVSLVARRPHPAPPRPQAPDTSVGSTLY